MYIYIYKYISIFLEFTIFEVHLACRPHPGLHRLLRPNAERYCSAALASGWIGPESRALGATTAVGAG